MADTMLSGCPRDGVDKRLAGTQELATMPDFVPGGKRRRLPREIPAPTTSYREEEHLPRTDPRKVWGRSEVNVCLCLLRQVDAMLPQG